MSGLAADENRLDEVGSDGLAVARALQALRRDDVALFGGLSGKTAEAVIVDLADRLGRADQLEMQSAFAGLRGHRSPVGRAFMSVNGRSDYEFISPRSEGTRVSGMQLAAFYCEENSTDGGYSFLFNTDPERTGWRHMKEATRRVDAPGRLFSPGKAAMLRARHQISLPDDLLDPDDAVLGEAPAPMPGVRLLEVLAPIRTARCAILGRDVNVYWDNIASVDHDNAAEFEAPLTHC